MAAVALGALLFLFSGAQRLQAQLFLSPFDTLVPMRDGQSLAVDLYLPDGPGPFPTALIQTPYNKLAFRFLGMPLEVGMDIDTSPFAFAVADWRCFYGSIGACTASPQRGEDGYDLVEWLAGQPWSDGQVGTWGPSALGQIQYMTAREQPPSPAGVHQSVGRRRDGPHHRRVPRRPIHRNPGRRAAHAPPQRLPQQRRSPTHAGQRLRHRHPTAGHGLYPARRASPTHCRDRPQLAAV